MKRFLAILTFNLLIFNTSLADSDEKLIIAETKEEKRATNKFK